MRMGVEIGRRVRAGIPATRSLSLGVGSEIRCSPTPHSPQGVWLLMI